VGLGDGVAVADFDDPNMDKNAALAGILEDDSPYPEVRSAVANTDDPDIPCSTFRAWTLGLIWAILIPVGYYSSDYHDVCSTRSGPESILFLPLSLCIRERCM